MGSDVFISWPALYRDWLLDANIDDGLIEGTLDVRTDKPARCHGSCQSRDIFDPLNRRWRRSLEERGSESKREDECAEITDGNSVNRVRCHARQ
jgi:hypothetical protein